MSLLFKNRQGANQKTLNPIQRLIGYWVGLVRQWLAALGEIWRDPIPSLLTIAVLGVSLTLPSTLYVVVKNAEHVEANWDSASEISLFFKADYDHKRIKATLKQIELMGEVQDVKFISKDIALAEFEQLSGFGDALSYLDSNPFPDVAIITPQPYASAPSQASQLLEDLKALPEVESGKLDIEWLRRLNAILSLVKDALISLALLLVVSVVLIVGNTIRLSIINRKDEIEVLKLVGATDGFIHRPFLFTGIWYGFFGGVIAWLAIEMMLYWISGAIERVALEFSSGFLLTGLSAGEMGYLLLLSMGLGLAGSWYVVNKQIRLIEPDAT